MLAVICLAFAAFTRQCRGDVFITHGPRNQRIRAGSPVTLQCSAGSDSLIRGRPTIQWLRDDEAIDLPDWRRFRLDPHDQSLTIDSVISADTGFYTCVAELDGERDTASAELVVEDVPDPPINVALISNCQNRVAEVRWQLISENYSPVTHFIIEYNTSFQPDSWTVAKSNVPPEKNYQRIALSPWGNYSFRVIAVNAVGRSVPSLPTASVCSTPPDVPHHNPRGVCTGNTRPHTLTITWEPVPMVDWNAPGFKYIVQWRGEGSDHSFEERIVEAPDHILEIENQPIYSPYEIFVKAFNRIGEAVSPPQMVQGYSAENVPLEIPMNFRLDPDKEVTSTTADFVWDPIMTGAWRMQGFFRGFKIQFWKTEFGPENLREHSIIYHEPDQCLMTPRSDQRAKQNSGSRYRGHLYNLWPYTNITARVLVLNSKYEGPPSSTVVFMTDEGVPSTVVDFQVVQKWPNQLMLQWEKPRRPHGTLVGYSIKYEPVDSTEEGLRDKVEINDNEVTDILLHGLQPDTSYRITIRARTRAGEGEHFIIESTTLPGGPPVQPNFTISELDRNSVNVSWFPSSAGNPGTSFSVEHRRIGHSQWQSSGPINDKNHYVLRHLVRAVLYEIRVVAYNGDYSDAPFTVSAIRTTRIGNVKVLPRPQFKVKQMKFTTVGVALLQPDPAIYSFHAQYRKIGYTQWMRTDAAARTGWAIMRRLSDGARYDVMVVVQSEYGEAESHVKSIPIGIDPAAQASVGVERNKAPNFPCHLSLIISVMYSLKLLKYILDYVCNYLDSKLTAKVFTRPNDQGPSVHFDAQSSDKHLLIALLDALRAICDFNFDIMSSIKQSTVYNYRHFQFTNSVYKQLVSIRTLKILDIHIK